MCLSVCLWVCLFITLWEFLSTTLLECLSCLLCECACLLHYKSACILLCECDCLLHYESACLLLSLSACLFHYESVSPLLCESTCLAVLPVCECALLSVCELSVCQWWYLQTKPHVHPLVEPKMSPSHSLSLLFVYLSFYTLSIPHPLCFSLSTYPLYPSSSSIIFVSLLLHSF